MIDGRYTLVRELGRGGMGAVWLAHDEILGRDVAIKRLVGGDQPGVAARAWREARLAASLSHSHVVSVFDLVTEDQDLWLVMEYVDGPSLARLVRERGPLSPAVAAGIVDDVAVALEAAHAAGIVHRDVKPGNILVPAHGPTKLGDFGIARGVAGDATLTMADTVTGSPVYLAPEVASGAPASPASDVWSLGATLFHLLTGRPPYEDGGNVLGVLYRIVHEPAPQTDRAGWLAPLLAGTMTHDPDARWSLAQVRAFLAAGPSARPTSPPPLSAVPAAPGEPAGPVTAVLPAVDAPPPAAGAPLGRAGRRSWIVLAAALGTVAVLAVVGAIVLSQRGGSPSTTAARDSHTPGPSPSGTASGSHSGSTTRSPSRSADAGPRTTPATTPTVSGVRNFVTTYLATAPADPARAFTMLTPGYQAASGGLAGYRSFWGQVSKVHSVKRLQATLQPLRATYTYTYTRRHVGTVTETVQLELVYVDGHYLISNGYTLHG